MTGPAAYRAAARVVGDLPTTVRQTRRDKGLGLRAAAQQIGMSHVHLHSIEAGAQAPGLPTVVKMLRWLGRQS